MFKCSKAAVQHRRYTRRGAAMCDEKSKGGIGSDTGNMKKLFNEIRHLDLTNLYLLALFKWAMIVAVQWVTH